MIRQIVFILVTACVSYSEIIFQPGFLFNYPLLPKFYEGGPTQFYGLEVALRVNNSISAKVGWMASFPYWDGPYNDVSNIISKTNLFKFESEQEILNNKVIGISVSGGAHYFISEWKPDDLDYEGPAGPFGNFNGKFHTLGFQVSPKMTFFKENQKMDWNTSISLPIYFGAYRNLVNGSKTIEDKLLNKYLNRIGVGFQMAFNFGVK